MQKTVEINYITSGLIKGVKADITEPKLPTKHDVNWTNRPATMRHKRDLFRGLAKPNNTQGDNKVGTDYN